MEMKTSQVMRVVPRAEINVPDWNGICAIEYHTTMAKEIDIYSKTKVSTKQTKNWSVFKAKNVWLHSRTFF
jgi:hypothetical protein